MNNVTAHESGHMFYATDEYKDPAETSGYLNATEVDNSGCLMDDNTLVLSSGTVLQIGWRDSDNDGVMDILDTEPNTFLIPYTPDPTFNNTPSYTGYAAVVPYPNNNPYGFGRDVTLNTISNVQFRINNGQWMNATPVDGDFDEAIETFQFTTTQLSPGVHLIETRAVNSVNNSDPTHANDTITILGDFEPPGIEETTQDVPVSGDYYNVTVDVTDNVEVDTVWFAYNITSSEGYYETHNISMNHSMENSYWNEVSIWSNATWFNYTIVANDASSNWNSTSTVNLNFRVHNLDTDEGFLKIQTAIDDLDTVDSNTIFVDSGIYYENVVVDKSINLTGEGRDNTIIDGGGGGDVVYVSANWVNITGFKITNASTGIRLDSSSNNSITRNDVFSNIWTGVKLSSSSNNTIENNNVSYNEGGISLGGSSNKITNNNIFSNNFIGISAGSGSNNSITSNNVYLNGFIGIGVKGHHNKITNNYIFSNSARGIDISSSSPTDITTDHKIINNSITNNSMGLFLLLTQNNLIIDNNIYSNNGDGISFGSSNNNTIRENNISNNDDGIYLYNASNNTITNNNVSLNNQFGFNVWSSFNNLIYHNNIINNTNQAYDDSNMGNKWDNGYPSGGNFWSDYTGDDIFSGQNQDIPGNDGIGDTNYSIDSDSRDNYPLMPHLGDHLFLFQGWNLISLPFIQSDTNLGAVLSSISGSYKAVQWYDPTDNNGPWKHNCTTKPDHLNDLDSLNHTVGFWVYVTDAGGVVLEYSGIPPALNQTIALYPGWNLVGYPALTNKSRDVALNNLTPGTEVDSIWTFNAATQSWEEVGPSDSFENGRGYWIHATQECEWEVPL